MAAKKPTKRASKKVQPTLQSSSAFDVESMEHFEADVPEKVKLDIFEVLAAIDRKDRGYYDRLDDKLKKSLPFPVLARWLSDVQGIQELQHWYLASTNVYANVNLYNVPADTQGQRHDKLTWLCLTAASPGMGRQRHGWIGLKKLDDNPKLKFLRKEYPAMKEQDIELLASIITDDEIREHLRISGQES